MIRILLPYHLRTLAGLSGEVELAAPEPATLGAVLDALEAAYPVLRGTIRNHDTLERRDFIRFFACNEDLSHEPMDAALPEAIVSGAQLLYVIGAIAGG